MSPFSPKVESLRAQVAQKDMFISELLDRIAIVECEVRRYVFSGFVLWRSGVVACPCTWLMDWAAERCRHYLPTYAHEVTSAFCMCLT